MLILPDIGSLAWVAARPPREGQLAARVDRLLRRPAARSALEDHPRYSATPEVTDRRSQELDRRLDEWEAEQRAKKADLDRREAALRERELSLREREIEKRERETDG